VALAGALGLSLLLASGWLVLRSGRAKDSSPVGSVPTVAPAAIGAPALVIDLQVTQAVGAVTDILTLHFDVDGRAVRDLSLSFPPDEQPVRRESVVIEGLSTGAHHLMVLASPEGNTSSSNVVQGDKDLNLAEGINRLPVKVTFVGSDSSIQFQ
jgi:hypothetical protein